VTEENQKIILDAYARMLRELDNADHELLFKGVPLPILHQMCLPLMPNIKHLLPNADDLGAFATFIGRIDTPDRCRQFIAGLSDPSSEELTGAVRELHNFPKRLKRVLQSAEKRIRPTGGAPKKLKDPNKIGQIFDEIHDSEKAGEDLAEIHQRILEREELSQSTLDRRMSDEKTRRAGLLKNQPKLS
jgi:hypothetical protein